MTSIDVAARAGVSRSTVSLVLAGKANGRVSDAVASRILRIAGELGYRPHAAAHTLRSGRSRTLAFVAFAPGDEPDRLPSATALFAGELAARERGYSIVVSTGRSSEPWSQLVEALNSSRVDGAVFTSLPGIMPQLDRFAGRCVLLGPRIGPVPAVGIDQIGAARIAMQHLFDLGHERIGYVWPALDGSRRRHGTYRRLMTQRGTDPEGLTASCRWSVEDARLATLALLRQPDPPTAIVCDDDVLAAGVYRAAALLGRRIPDQLSVLAFMDSRQPHVLAPELTVVELDYTAIGRRAVEVLIDLLEGHPTPEKVTIKPRLTPASSTAPPPRSHTSAVGWALQRRPPPPSSTHL